MEIEQDIATWMRAGREKLEISQMGLAVRLGKDTGSVSRWERGLGLPDLESFRKLCEMYGASADDALKLPRRRKAAP